ncbi:MAG: DNA polymerase III subunit alpha [Candidatus Sumerlaeia bacterium]|nr:DNA polymerase III subunit alpha [Candidatus Sumerlaeia bacterium]
MAPDSSDFVHLHVHSEYSLLDGANRIEPMVKYAKELGQTAIALTDHGVMFGMEQFRAACKKHEIKPILGCEMYITPNHRTARGNAERREIHHLTLLAENFQGYRNLMKLSSIGHVEGFYSKPRIDFETLEAHKEGLIATSSCLAGLIPQSFVRGDEKKALEYTSRFVDLFGRERFFIEMMDHGISDQHTANAGLLRIARDQNLRMIATNDCHYLRKEDHTLHDVLMCVQMGCCVADTTRMKYVNEFYIKSTQEMAAIFSEHPEAILNTRLVAEMCNVDFPEKEYHVPRFECPDGLEEPEYLEKVVWEGARMRYGARSDTDEVLRDRIKFELGVILEMGFPGYFLIVADFIDYARKSGIPVGPGRGSAAGSVVAYCMRITELDPLEHNLLFERFLNPDRLSMPDIDVDFSNEGRGEVIEYVRKKYGEKCVAQIVTFGTMKAKAAIRDVGRALGIELKRVDRVAKLVPEGPKINLKKALEESVELRQMIEGDPELQRLYEYASGLEGMSRHTSTHAAGVVIADRDITDYVPLYKSPKEEGAVTQFDMNEVEELGLLKMDFLGIKNLSIIQRVERWLKERENIDIDWDKLNHVDEKTYMNLHKGQTAGVFQLESAGMTKLVKSLKPTNFADLTALLAIYRPGPLRMGMDAMYVKRKHGQEKVAYDHPILEPILKETFGIFLYQEQVMRVAMEMCGFTRGEADMLRKAMGKKQVDKMEKMLPQFIAGAKEKSGVDERLSKHIWDQIAAFAEYGFNKSHSAAYAMITFQTAYLRANFPVYFQAALLTNELGGSTDNIAKYVTNARECRIEVMPVDINHSLEYFNPDPATNRVYYAMGAVKTVGTSMVRAIVAERENNGTFKSFQDFMMRVPTSAMNSRMVEALIKVGAFDSLHDNRAALMHIYPDLMEAAQQKQSDDGTDMFDLGEAAEDLESFETPIPKVEDWSDKDRANYEKEFLGFYLSEHPLNKYRIELESYNHVKSSEIDEIADKMEETDKRPLTMIGCITTVQIRIDKNNRPWAIVGMEDLDGTFDVKFFSKAYEMNRQLLEVDRVIEVDARLSKWQGRASIDAWEARNADDLREMASGIELEVDVNHVDSDLLLGLKSICMRYGGTRQLRLKVNHPEAGTAEFRLNGKMRLSINPDAITELFNLPGHPKVRYFR